MDERRAREAAELVPDGAIRMGLNGPIPDHLPPHVIKPGVTVRRFPAHYVRAEHGAMLRIWRLKRDGYMPRSDGALLWPARLIQALELIDRECDELRATRNSKR
jgi:hypothetical protein